MSSTRAPSATGLFSGAGSLSLSHHWQRMSCNNKTSSNIHIVASTSHHLLDKYLAVSLVHCFSLSLLLLLFPPSCPPSSPSPSAGRNSSGCWWSFNKQHIFRTFYFNTYIALKSPHKLSPKIFMTKNDTLLFAPSKWLGIPSSETIKLESSWGCHLGWVLPL